MTEDELMADWQRCMEQLESYSRMYALTLDDFLRKLPDELREAFVEKMDQPTRRIALGMISLADDTRKQILKQAMGDSPPAG